MEIPAGGREWAHWTLTDAPTGDLHVQLDGVGDWHILTRDSATEAKLLIAGPSAPAPETPDGAVELGVGTHHARIRAIAGDEVIIRPAGYIAVTA